MTPTNVAALAAHQLLKRFQIEGPPVYVAGMLDEFGVRYIPDPGIKRAFVRKGADGTSELIFNPDRPRGDLRVDGAHEFGHIVLNHQGVLFAGGRGLRGVNFDSKRTVEELRRDRAIEDQADSFAVHLLAPFAWVRDHICCKGMRDRDQLAAAFGVNTHFIGRALKHHRLQELIMFDPVRWQRYLASDAWKAKRLEILARRPECERCGASRYQELLNVHHLVYRIPGHEREEDLVVLCDKHHLLAHGREDIHPGQLRLDAA